MIAGMIGYARVSTHLQKLDLQITALENAGCERIYCDNGQSGRNFDREGLSEVLKNINAGETLVVWRLDRLGRSLSKLVTMIDHLGQRQVQFRSITESIDTNSSGGRLMFHMMAALAEFERALISERTRAGLLVARAQGKRLGRPCALTTQQVRDAWELYVNQKMKLKEIAILCGVSPRTLRRLMSGDNTTDAQDSLLTAGR